MAYLGVYRGNIGFGVVGLGLTFPRFTVWGLGERGFRVWVKGWGFKGRVLVKALNLNLTHAMCAVACRG